MNNPKNSSILVLVGARFLGHAYPLASLVREMKLLTSLPVYCSFLPLAEGNELPGASFLSQFVDEVEIHQELVFDMDRSAPIRDYADLLRALGFGKEQRVETYVTALKKLISGIKPSLIISDSLPGIPQLSRSFNIPMIAMRSHGLKQRFDFKVARDVFLDVPLDKNTLEKNELLARNISEACGEIPNNLTIDDLYYSSHTITPGFNGFDVCPLSSSQHIFMRLGTLPDRIKRKKTTNVLVYIRDCDLKFFVTTCLNECGYNVIELDDNDKSGVDFWGEDIQVSIIVSHGGHGMASAALYQQVPHIAIADTDDRYTIGCRIEAENSGVVLDARRNTLLSKEDLICALNSLPIMKLDRKLFNSTSYSPIEVADWCLSMIEPKKGFNV